MKRLLLFTLTLCFCINIQAKESTVVYKLNGYKTLSITGNFEKGLLTEGPVQFDYKTAAHTVKLEGKYFTPNVKTNDIVMPGDLLATIELDKIIEAGYDPTVMVIDTADSSKRNVTLLAKNTVHAKDDLVLIESI